MKVQSSNKQKYYITTLQGCNCLDYSMRNKSQNRLSCNCEKWYKCEKCSCYHQRDNLAKILQEAALNV